ncbi:phage tail sheath protein [Biomaibacter acetigenes]|uniref:Phage tail sheath protein n=1 Tax=Biomaibacter acetigenes TaxID=2316383 RepID=A0A3G2R459_9FIRM|nr:phage tail sheath protein [Biomaibacter acetigenes]AYO30253.1 phage tail sheath protein [Biomaibacter acetigenes]
MYIHGAYADLQPTQDLIPPKGVSTLPVYFGRLPVHQLMDYSGKVNKPILVQSFSDAVTKVGYNDSNWDDFDLCEAIYAHFKNSIQVIGPVILVNVLDPDTHKTSAKTTSVTLTNGQGYINNDKVILKTVAITGKVLGTDFSAEYTPDGTKVLIKDLKGTLTSPVDVTFDEVNPDAITATEVIGGTNSTTGEKTGISVVDLVYQTYNMIPTILDAPGWSHHPEVDAALKAAAQKINGHWYAFVNSNLAADTSADTIEEVKTWKSTNGYTGANEAPCWPLAKNGNRKFHLSTLATVTMQWVDYNNDNIPYETPSNKPVDVTGMCLADGAPIEFDQVQANDLNSKGIRTLTYWGGRWVLWGPHTGEYEYGKDMDPRNKFDSSVRMLYYLVNDFQSRYGAQVDKPMDRARVDTILNDYQEFLDSLVNRGALLYGTISFNETSNPTSDIVEGDFVFDVATTTTPPGKSITAKIEYTTQGIDVLFGGEQA